MAEFGDEKTPLNGSIESDDILSDLEALSKKYGLEYESGSVKKPRNESVSSQYSPKRIDGRTDFTPPKNNRPARTPRIVYDAAKGSSSVRIVYGDEPQGPQGRRVIYEEEEPEPIAEKRRRASSQPKISEKGSAGFGSSPYVRHVASSESAILRDDYDRFSKTYEDKVHHTPSDETLTTAPAPARTEKKDKLVATNPDAVKKNGIKADAPAKKTAKERLASFFKSFLPWKGDPAKEVVRKLIMDISAILVLVCFGYFIDNYIQHKNQLENQNNLKNLAESETSDLDAQWAAIRKKYPDIDFPEGMNIKYAELYAANQDLVGWLKVPGTNIDTAVLHCPQDRDNSEGEEDFYLHHNFYKQYDKYGNAYLESTCTGLTLDRNNTIYGHNMRDGLSFAQLEKYYTIDGFKESPLIQYSTLFEDYTFKVYAAFITNGYPSGDNGYLFSYPVASFTNDENFLKFIEAIDERKLYDTGVDINSSDKLIILSTCSYEIKTTDMGRLAVAGRLVRDGESTAVDTSKAKDNENIRYPQVWYDEHNQSNPFKNAYRWIPE